MSTPEDWCQTTPPTPKEACETQNPYFEPDSLCENGWQPLLLTGLFRDMLIRHFSDPKELRSEDLRQFIWKPGADSGILIESAYRWRGDLVEKRPAILVKRNAYRQRRLGIRDEIIGAGTDSALFKNERGAHTIHTVNWMGSHTIFCIHGTGASCEILASEVVDELTVFTPAIRQQLLLEDFQVTEVGEISELEEATENYVIPITVGWVYNKTWQLKLESLPLRKVVQDLNLKDC
jgi:hypothetical protein